MKKQLIFIGMLTFISIISFGQLLNTSTKFEKFSQVSTTILDHPADGVLTIYPNPIIDFVTIEDNESLEIIKIYNLNGELIKEQIVNENIITINLSNYKSGIYIITSNNKVKRVIKQ